MILNRQMGFNPAFSERLPNLDGKMVIVDGEMVTTNRLLGTNYGKMEIVDGGMAIYHGFFVIETCHKSLKASRL